MLNRVSAGLSLLVSVTLLLGLTACGASSQRSGSGKGGAGSGQDNGGAGGNTTPSDDEFSVEFPDDRENPDGGTGSGSNEDRGCRQVDLLYAVDNSGSMSEEKASLSQEVFPAFARELEKISGGLEDYRVGVIDACATQPQLHTRGVSGECAFEGAKPWMTSASNQLIQEFQCVSDIDSSGSACTGNNDDEQPASAAAALVEATASAAEPFARDTALLVVVAITDEDEQPVPSATASEVYQRLIALKGGDPTRMVFLGIGGGSSCQGVYGGARHSRVLQEVSERFADQGQGLFWDLCMGKLEDGFAQALQLIDSACTNFVPIE